MKNRYGYLAECVWQENSKIITISHNDTDNQTCAMPNSEIPPQSAQLGTFPFRSPKLNFPL
jgi:hypothetical protein